MVADPKPPYAEFGIRLAAALDRVGLGVPDVAKALRITPEMARRYRMGIAMPRQQKLQQLAALLGMTPGELQFGEVNERTAASGLISGVVLARRFDRSIDESSVHYVDERGAEAAALRGKEAAKKNAKSL